ncbi:hypothetical protein U9M48_043913 [Paspalum notatum var. saurae]|uniref:Uncharacterized protein n=1 Tax=Paspalum notatum var. saurae TaxID=547442 RepID=A0AAQ3UU24_PASNO
MASPHNQTKFTMGSSSSNSSDVPLPATLRPLHVTDTDEEDENVKQLKEIASLSQTATGRPAKHRFKP